MERKQFVEQNPLRELDKILNNKLKPGDFITLASQKGVGKTPFLINIAIDAMFRDRNVFHLSLGDDDKRIAPYYDELFYSMASLRKLENSDHLWKEVLLNRLLRSFKTTSKVEKILKYIDKEISELDFFPNMIIIDDYPINETTLEDMELLKSEAEKRKVKILISFSFSSQRRKAESLSKTPVEINKYMSIIDRVWTLEQDKGLYFNIIKDENLSPNKNTVLELDPKTLLITRK